MSSRITSASYVYESGMLDKHEMSEHKRYELVGDAFPGSISLSQRPMLNSSMDSGYSTLSSQPNIHQGPPNAYQSTSTTTTTTTSNIIHSTTKETAKLPKKRKYDPNEIERTTFNNNNNINHHTNNSIPSTIVSSPSSSVVVMPTQTLPVDYSLDGLVPKLPKDMPRNSHSELRDEPSPRKQTFIDLSEWRDHRVLAKREEVYLPGVIKQVLPSGDVGIEFDSCETVNYFNDLLGSGKYDVIGDASPPKDQVTLGSRVCIRLPEHHQVFYEGIVLKIFSAPVQFLVKLTRPGNEEYVVKRADIRLLIPPWWDELESFDQHARNFSTNQGTPSRGSTGHPPPLETPPQLPPQTSTLIVHHQLPQHLGLHTGGDSLAILKSAATSPVHLTPMSQNSGTALSNGSTDELRGRNFEDFGESDDELRKEDILFPSDAGL